MTFLRPCLIVAMLAALPVAASPLTDPLPEPWRAMQQARADVTQRACDGDADAMAEVDALVLEQDPVMLTNFSWLWENCSGYDETPDMIIAALDAQAAKSGYPVALYHHGLNLILGVGLREDVTAGMGYLRQAVDAGYGEAALAMADEYIYGEIVEKDLEKAAALIEEARALGTNADSIAITEGILRDEGAGE